MKLNGWQRLWVVAMALWSIPVGVFAYQKWPTVARMTARHELSLSVNGSGRFAVLDRSLTVGIYDSADEMKVAWYWIVLRRQAIASRRAFALWMVPAVAFYALWWTIELGLHSQFPPKKWMVYDVNSDGSLSTGKVFMDVSADTTDRNPDGMKVDAFGNVYAAGPGGVLVISPEGKHLWTILIPEIVSNSAWGDADFKTLYVTARTRL